jgi:limonene 1,2-monooxygenase
MPTPLKFGLFMAPFHAPGQHPTLTYERDLELIGWVDTLGFDEAWIGEHHSCGWETIPSPELMIATAAGRTRHVRLGAAVVSLPFHHPFHVAERYAFLDHLTRGRVMLGIGPGALPADADMFGLDPAQQRAMMNEGLEVILRLYRSEEPVTHQGSYFTLKNARLQVRPYQYPHLPIGVSSGGGPNGVVQAGKHGLMLLSAGMFSPAGLAGIGSQWGMVEAAAADAGRTADRAAWRVAQFVYVAESLNDAMDDVRRGGDALLQDYFIRGLGANFLFEDYPGQPVEEITVEKLVARGGAIVGSPEDVMHGIERLQQASGGFGGFLIITNDWTSREKTLRSYERFARYVIPHFQHTLAPTNAAYAYAREVGPGLLQAAIQAMMKGTANT